MLLQFAIDRRLGNKIPDKFEHLSQSYSMNPTRMAPDKTNLGRQKHKNLLSELKAKRTQAESGLITRPT